MASAYGLLALLRERPEHALDQRGVAIFLDQLDLAVLDAPHHAILIVIALTLRGDVVAAGFHHDGVALGDEIVRYRARPIAEAGADLTEQAVEDGVLSLELV